MVFEAERRAASWAGLGSVGEQSQENGKCQWPVLALLGCREILVNSCPRTGLYFREKRGEGMEFSKLLIVAFKS